MLKNRYENFMKDKLLLVSVILDLCLIGLHVFQYIDSDYMIEPLVRIILCAVYPVVVFFLGRTGFFYFYFVYGNILALSTTFQNYTAFIILCLFTVYKPKMKHLTLFLYVCEILFIATYRGKTPSHIAIHFIECIIFYVAITKTVKIKPPKKLDLLPDDIKILEKLAEGCSQKEIALFSPNTICLKLKKARERNQLKNNDELLLAFIEERKV